MAFGSSSSNFAPGDNNQDLDIFVHDRVLATTTWISTDPTGIRSDGWAPSISADGQFVAFQTWARFAPSDRTAVDIYVQDRLTGSLTHVSVDSSGAGGNDESTYPSISGDGRFVAFESLATNLVGDDTYFFRDVFVHDIQTGATVRASVDSGGLQAEGESGGASMSADGRFVAFWSDADNLVPGDTGGTDIFVRDLQGGTISRVSVDSSGAEANAYSLGPSISRDGRFVAFESWASNLVPGDTAGHYDIFVHDRRTGTTTRASVDSSGGEANEGSAYCAISGDGRFVVFLSGASNLAPGDTNGKNDTFVHGPYLTLEAIPESVATGASLLLTTWKGLVGGKALLAVVGVNGVPLFQPAASGSFGGDGLWSLSRVVPPGIAGNVVTLQGFGFAPTGGLDLTNHETVTIQ